MEKHSTRIIREIQQLEVLEENLTKLDSLIQELFTVKLDESDVPFLLETLVKFQEIESYGVLWGILHGIESIKNNETYLIESVKQSPTEMTILMINRLINGGVNQVNDDVLLQLLKDISENQAVNEEIRNQAGSFLNYQETKQKI